MYEHPRAHTTPHGSQTSQHTTLGAGSSASIAWRPVLLQNRVPKNLLPQLHLYTAFADVRPVIVRHRTRCLQRRAYEYPLGPKRYYAAPARFCTRVVLNLGPGHAVTAHLINFSTCSCTQSSSCAASPNHHPLRFAPQRGCSINTGPESESLVILSRQHFSAAVQ